MDTYIRIHRCSPGIISPMHTIDVIEAALDMAPYLPVQSF